MNQSHTSAIERVIISWVQFIERNRIPVIISIIALTIASVFYIKDNLGMSTSTTDMLSEELLWRKLDIEYEKLFPQFTDNILVVIEAPTPDQASDTAKLLYSALEQNSASLNDIYYPALLPYFRQSAFLFLDVDELQDLSDRLAKIQPFLGTLIADQNLRGLFNMLSDAIQAKQDGEDIDIKPLLHEINHAFENENHQVSWQRLMSPDSEIETVYREFITLQTKDNSESLLPDEDIIENVRSTIDSMGLKDSSSINIRLSGGTVLSYEELKSVSKANIQAIALSFFLVAIILLIGLGSIWLVSACLITLLLGLIVTTAFATATVGELNLISVAFAVLYIGLGIDFAIHMTLRFREEKLNKLDNDHALKKAIVHIFRSLVLCAITTAIGFYSFIPTDYQGVAELGWIAGSGMFISLMFTFTLLPALLSFFSYKQATRKPGRLPELIKERLIKIPYEHSEAVLLITFLIVVGLGSQLNRISFDTNTLNLQDPENESVQTYRDLLKDSKTSPWSGVLIKENITEVQLAKQNIESLSLVDKVVWLNDFIPEQQEDKLFIIDEMNLLLGVLTSAGKLSDISNEERLKAINDLNSKLESIPTDELDNDLRLLKNNLDNLLLKFNAYSNDDHFAKLEQQLLNSFSGRINSLSDALNAEEVELGDIPLEVYERWVSNDYYKMQILPLHNLNENAAMKNFVAELQTYDENVIGSPIISIEAGNSVITAFKSAFTYALIAIAILLLLLIRVKKDAANILLSVFVGGVFTFGFMLLFNIPLNFANIIGLPLLLGMGVDSGIHIADRFRQEYQSGRNIFMTSSSRGVIVSSLTTIFSIGNLAFSSHQGTASMGLLLSLGLASMMVSTMIILPAFIVWQNSLTGK
jgi:uncharacterized protein